MLLLCRWYVIKVKYWISCLLYPQPCDTAHWTLRRKETYLRELGLYWLNQKFLGELCAAMRGFPPVYCFVAALPTSRCWQFAVRVYSTVGSGRLFWRWALIPISKLHRFSWWPSSMWSFHKVHFTPAAGWMIWWWQKYSNRTTVSLIK